MDPLSSMASRILPILIDVLQRLDKECWNLLKPHVNKIICFKIDHLSPLYFQIKEQGLQSIDIVANQHIDTTFQGPMSAFIAMIFTKNRVQSGLHVKGDLECAKALYDSWHHLDLDWEGHLATLFGGTIAHSLSQGFAQSRDWFHQTWQARQEDLGAYLQDEVRLLPTRMEVDTLFNEIDKIRHDVARFEAKLLLLQQRLENR